MQYLALITFRMVLIKWGERTPPSCVANYCAAAHRCFTWSLSLSQTHCTALFLTLSLPCLYLLLCLSPSLSHTSAQQHPHLISFSLSHASAKPTHEQPKLQNSLSFHAKTAPSLSHACWLLGLPFTPTYSFVSFSFLLPGFSLSLSFTLASHSLPRLVLFSSTYFLFFFPSTCTRDVTPPKLALANLMESLAIYPFKPTCGQTSNHPYKKKSSE